MASLTFDVQGSESMVEDELQEARALDAVQLRLAVKQLRKARIKIDKLTSGYVRSCLEKTLERTSIVLALASVPRGGCIGENYGIPATIAAIGAEISSREDLIVLCTHVIFLQNNFMCQCSSGALPPNWTDKSGGYATTYTHPKISDYRIGLKCVVMGGKILLHCAIDGDQKMHDLEVSSSAYFASHVKIPNNRLKLKAKTIAGSLEYASAIRLCFDGNDALQKLRESVEENLIHKILKGSSGETTGNVNEDRPNKKRSTPDGRSTFVPPRNAEPDLRGHPPLVNVGHDDLGPNIRGPGGFGSNGSLVGPNHPMFHGRNNGVDFPQYGGRMPPGVPPNARFDPFGPSVPRPGSYRGGRGRGNFGSGMPNHDHLRMPGEEDFMYM